MAEQQAHGPLEESVILGAKLSMAIDGIGTRRFERALILALNEILGVDHCTINSYSPQGGMNSITVASRIDVAVGRSLTRDYVSRYYPFDPNFPDLERYRRTQQFIVRTLDIARIQSPEYLNRFHASSVAMDKIAIIWYENFKAYNLNLYRSVRFGRYSSADHQLVTKAAPFLTSIARQHCRHVLARRALSTGNMMAFLERLADAAEPTLTRRELDVVGRIASGLRMEAIAAELGIGVESAVSYRKRAYKKLRVGSQAELFALCLRSLHRFVH